MACSKSKFLASMPKLFGTILLLINACLSLRPNSGVSDPWGENQRPKLYTDYLTQHSGRLIFISLVINWS